MSIASVFHATRGGWCLQLLGSVDLRTIRVAAAGHPSRPRVVWHTLPAHTLLVAMKFACAAWALLGLLTKSVAQHGEPAAEHGAAASEHGASSGMTENVTFSSIITFPDGDIHSLDDPAVRAAFDASFKTSMATMLTFQSIAVCAAAGEPDGTDTHTCTAAAASCAAPHGVSTAEEEAACAAVTEPADTAACSAVTGCEYVAAVVCGPAVEHACGLVIAPDTVSVVGIAAGSVVVAFTITVPRTSQAAMLDTIDSARDHVHDFTVEGLHADVRYMHDPAINDVCEVVDCGHDEHCVPEDCASKDCYPVPCPEDGEEHPDCFLVTKAGYNASKVMCGDAPCIPHSCSHGERECVPVVCTDEHGNEEGGHASDPCHAGHHGGDGLGFWPFLLFALLIAVLATSALNALGAGACCGKSLNLPFTVVMFFTGYFISRWVQHEHDIGVMMKDVFDDSHMLISSVDSWKATHPHVILFCLLPPLLFEDAASMEFYTFRKVLLSSMLLAGPGVGISMCLTAATTMAIFGFDNVCGHACGFHEECPHGTEVGDYVEGPDPHTGEAPLCEDQLPIPVHLLLGGMLSATDPVAVCAVLNDLGCPDKLNYMIAGESLLNDGTAVVAFLVLQSVAGGCGHDGEFGPVLVALIKLAGGGVVWGLLMAAFCYHYCKTVNDPNIEITLVVFSTYFTFWVKHRPQALSCHAVHWPLTSLPMLSMLTSLHLGSQIAENWLGVSGVLGTVVFGVQTARTSLLAMDEHSHHASHAFWHEVGYVATAMIFMVAGVCSCDKINRFLDESTSELSEGEFHVENMVGKSFLVWFILTFIRTFVIMSMWPILTKIGYGLTLKEVAVMVWGGLRGAVSLSLALLVDGNHLINEKSREMIFMQTVGLVTLTLLVNGTTSGLVYKTLKVYPDSPYRALLATQGLRNLHMEMEKVVYKLSKHWFHQNARTDVLCDLMPNFVEASLYDGDLVGYSLEDVHSTWKRGVSEKGGLSPQRLIMDGVGSAAKALQMAGSALRVGYSSASVGDHHKKVMAKALEPDAYAQMGVAKGGFYEYDDCDVSVKTANPTWEDADVNRSVVKIPDGGEPVTMYIHMLDNDLGEDDDYLGEARLDITALVASGQSATKTVDLTACTHVIKKIEHKGIMPVAVKGSVTVKIECQKAKSGMLMSSGMPLDCTVTITMISAKDLGTGDDEPEEEAHGGDHGDDVGHGHGDHDMAFLLQNVRRWVGEATSESEASEEVTAKLPEFAMYEILILGMKSHFHHMRESDTLSIAAMSQLYAACGVAFDINTIALDALATTVSNSELALPDGVTSNNPLSALVDQVCDFCDNGAGAWAACMPAQFYEHKMIAGEMLYAIIDAWGTLEQVRTDSSAAGKSDDFADAAKDGLDRLKKKYAAMVLAYPNTFKAVHTHIAFKEVVAQYKGRIAEYGSQGFFTEAYVDAATGVVKDRAREMEQYLHIETINQWIGLVTMNMLMIDHAVVACFTGDTGSEGTAETPEKTNNPASDDLGTE